MASAPLWRKISGIRGQRTAPDGKLVVAEFGAKRTVQIDPARGTVTEIVGNLSIGLPSNIPTGVGVGASGAIYFSSDVQNAIYKVARQ